MMRCLLIACLSCSLPASTWAQRRVETEPVHEAIPLERVPRSDLRRSRLSSEVDRSIRNGVKFLISQQNADGSWTSQAGRDDFTVGTTALVTLALLSCGESHQSEPLINALKYLRSAKPQAGSKATYTIALRAAVYSQLPGAVRDKDLRADMNWLQNAMIASGPLRGMYGYTSAAGTRGGWGDYSNSQYGVLGVWYGAMAGVEVPLTYWRQVENAWREGQNPDGGWGYKPGMRRSYASMTAAGAATLFVTNDHLYATQGQNLLRPTSNKPLDDSINWLSEYFAVDHNPGMDTKLTTDRPKNLEDQLLDQLLPLVRERTTWTHYMLFSYERVGEASGLTRFGKRKWFDEGAGHLIRTQKYDGSWTADMGTEIDTAYALLFLSRGRAPVIVQKLQFEGRWNNRSRDVVGFVAFMRRATERHVNWQIVSTDATPGELREAPILYVASDRPLKLTPEQKQRLKNYVEQGGLILWVNEGRENAFARSVISLALELFPQYEFRDLPQDHPIFSANFPMDGWTDPMRGLSNGIRELMILVPSGDASWRWQSAGGAFDMKRAPYAPLANLVLYVTDSANPRYKGEDTWVDRNAAVSPSREARIARLRYDGNWDPEPGGWVRLSNVLYNFDQIQLLIASVTAEQIPRAASLAHLAATTRFELTPPQLAGVREYLDGGGLLLLDAAGGSAEAAIAFESMLNTMYPQGNLAPLPLDHPVYEGRRFGGQIIEEVDYRRSLDRPQTRLPRLKGFTVDGKLVAIVSNEDLTAGLVAYQTMGPIGYTPQSATDLMRNIVMWASHRGTGD